MAGPDDRPDQRALSPRPGGRDDGGAYRSEVRKTSWRWSFVHLPPHPDYHVQIVLLHKIRYWSTIRIPGTPGSRLGISQLAEHFILSWLLGLSMLPAWQVKNKTQNFFLSTTFCAEGRILLPNRLNFWKNSKRRMTPHPPSLLENYDAIFL